MKTRTQTPRPQPTATAAVLDAARTTRDQRMVAITLIYTAIVLTAIEYFGSPQFAANVFPQMRQPYFGLYPHLWWAGITILLYLPIPLLIVKGLFRHRLRDYGLTLVVKQQHLLLYGAMLLIMAPIVLYASTRADFVNIYPFYRGAVMAPAGAVLAWELAYAIQFIALEFFFRGFLVLGLERHIGRCAVWVAMVPYCMIHYHKPPLEAFAAIIAGILLGEVARRTRSILGGVLVHLCVALSMDALALARLRP